MKKARNKISERMHFHNARILDLKKKISRSNQLYIFYHTGVMHGLEKVIEEIERLS